MSTEQEHDEFEAAFDAAVEGNELEEVTEAEEAEEVETESEERETPDKEEETPAGVTGDENTELDIDALIRERDDYRQKFQSNNGRISAYQKQIDELQQSNAHLASQVSKAVDDTDSRSEAQEQLAESIGNTSWAELEEDMPDVAKAINDRLSEVLNERLQSIDQKINPITQSLQEQKREREMAVLSDRHPDWHDIAQSSEFSQWLGQQPDAVQQLSSSESAADAAYLLDSYKLQNQTEPAGSNLKQRNQAKLRNSIAAPSKRLSRTAPSMDDFDAAFDAAVARDRR